MSIFAICIAAIVLEAAIEFGLEMLNAAHVRRHHDVPPESIRGRVDQETYRRSVDYTLTKSNFAIVAAIYSLVWLVAFIAAGAFGRIEAWLSQQISGPLSLGAVYVLLIWLICTAMELPSGLYRTFIIEQRFGFNRMTFKLWLFDLLKGLLISLVVMTPVVYGVLFLMGEAPRRWWLYAALLLSGVQLLMLYLYPVAIAPLFNKFNPLGDGPVRDRIMALTERLKFPVAGVFTMDGSRRSSHSNAYFAGFGRNKRIVLFDTLLSSLSEDQVIAVLAHEIGHQKRRHNIKLLCLSLAITLLGFWIVSLLVGFAPLYHAFGYRAPSFHAALVVAAILSGPVLGLCAPLINSLVRRYEYQADRFAVEAEGGGHALKEALITLAAKNLSNPVPHPWYSFFHYSHPTLGERLAAIDRIA